MTLRVTYYTVYVEKLSSSTVSSTFARLFRSRVSSHNAPWPSSRSEFGSRRAWNFQFLVVNFKQIKRGRSDAAKAAGIKMKLTPAAIIPVSPIYKSS